jgi:hypothetical protein
VIAAVVTAAAALAAAAPQAAIVGFRTPSGNIGCQADTRILRCDVLSGLRPEPRAACELDWTGLLLGPRGRARPSCAGDTAVDRGAPVLAYGRRWRHGPFACLSRRVGLRCTNAAGHGFFLSREGWRGF